MILPWHKTVTHKVKPDLAPRPPKFNADGDRVCPWEYHLSMMAWHATRQAYVALLKRRRDEHQKNL